VSPLVEWTGRSATVRCRTISCTERQEWRHRPNAIIGFSEVLGERLFGELNDTLINEILDLSKVEAGRMELEVWVKYRNKETGKLLWTEFEADPATVRHYIERLIPAARQGVDIGMGTPEEFYKAIQEARRDRENEKQ
jgi:signal transduction histidine kinase